MKKTTKHKKIEWNPNLPLSTLPEEIRNFFTKEAEFLYNDLRENKQNVVLVPAPFPYEDRNKIRVADSFPPDWYSGLYYSLSRNRHRTLQALLRIANSKDGEFKKHHYKADVTLRHLIFDRLTCGYEDFGKSVPPNKKVKEYFTAK